MVVAVVVVIVVVVVVDSVAVAVVVFNTLVVADVDFVVDFVVVADRGEVGDDSGILFLEFTVVVGNDGNGGGKSATSVGK